MQLEIIKNLPFELIGSPERQIFKTTGAEMKITEALAEWERI